MGWSGVGGFVSGQGRAKGANGLDGPDDGFIVMCDVDGSVNAWRRPHGGWEDGVWSVGMKAEIRMTLP